MTNPTRFFENGDGNQFLLEPYLGLARQESPGQLARLVAKNRQRYRDAPASKDHEFFQTWKPLPLKGCQAEAWFPLVIRDGLGRDGKGAIPGQLVRLGMGLDPEQSVQVPKKHLDAAKAWIKTIVGDPQMVLPMEHRLDVRMTLSNDLPTYEFSSCELACACVLVSHLTQRTSRSAVVASGKLNTQQPWEVSSIGFSEIKTDIVDAESRAAQQLVTPLIVGKPIDSDSVLKWMEELYGAKLEEALKGACRRTEQGMIYQAVKIYDSDRKLSLRLAEAAKDKLSGTDKAVALWLIGANLMHDGVSDKALEHIKEAKSVWGDQDVDRYPKAFLRPWLKSLSGIALIDNGHVSDALNELAETLDQLKRQKMDTHDWRTTATYVAGSLRRALLADGQLERAIDFYEDWIEAVPIQERSRCWGDLAVMYWAKADPAQAKVAIKEADSLLAYSTDEARPGNRRYQEFFRMRMGMMPLPSQPPPWQVGQKMRFIDFCEAVLWHAHSDSFVPFVRKYKEYCRVSTDSIATGWVVLRGIAEHIALKGADARLESELLDFVRESKNRLDANQAGAMIDALTALENGNPGPWLRVAPY